MASFFPFCRLPLLIVILLALTFSASGQFLSGVEGTVHDSSGAVIPNAKVSLTDTRLNVTKTVNTSDSGYFRIDSLAASTYNLQVTAGGFTEFTENGLALQVGETRTLSPELKVGSTETVTVTAAAASLNLSAATTGSIMSEETVSVTPLGGQNVYGLASLTPGITGSGTNSPDNYTN